MSAPGSVSRVRRGLVWSSAALLCVLGSLVGLAVWAIGLGRYLEDYCFTRVSTPLEESIHGPVLERPWTVRCEYGVSPDIVVTDPAPLLWTVVVGFVVLVGVLAVLRVAWLLTRRPGSPPDAGPTGRPSPA